MPSAIHDGTRGFTSSPAHGIVSLLKQRLAVLTGMCWYLTVVGICISPMADNAEHILCAYLICMYTLWSSVLVLCPFLNWVIFLSYGRSLYILDTSPFQMYDVKIFFPTMFLIFSIVNIVFH